MSCHPEQLLPGARTVISAALCYSAPAPEPGPGEGRLARYTWSDRYDELREKLDALGRRLGGAYRVLVDANQHVDREGAARAGVGFYGKNTLLITRRHGSWVVLGTLVTDIEVEPSTPLDADCGSCTPLHRRLPDRRAGRARHARLDPLPLVLDAGARRRVPEPYRAELGASSTAATSARTCARGTGAIEKRRAGEPLPDGAEPTVSLVDWLEADGRRARRALRAALRAPQRSALAAPERARRRRQRRRRGRAAGCRGVTQTSDDPLLREHAAWALERIDER